jgi:hypothetical protein
MLAVIASSINTFFSMRAPTVQISPVVAQLIAYPIGDLWAAYMPSQAFRTFGREWSLNPGPFTIKEHTLIVAMANVSFYPSLYFPTQKQLNNSSAVPALQALKIFYKQRFRVFLSDSSDYNEPNARIRPCWTLSPMARLPPSHGMATHPRDNDIPQHPSRPSRSPGERLDHLSI